MWSPGATLEFLLAVLAFWFVWRLVTRLKRPSEPAEPEPGEFAGSPARLHPRPGRGASAVALAEPEGDDELTSYPPRITGNRS